MYELNREHHRVAFFPELADPKFDDICYRKEQPCLSATEE
jgi:hypothetical protein